MNFQSVLGFAFGPIAAAVLGLIAVPATAWVFAPEDVGRLNVLQITLSFSLLLFVLGLDQAYVREYHESKKRAQLLRTCFMPGFVFLLITCSIGGIFASIFANWLFDLKNKWLFYGVFACFLFDFINRFLSLILRMKEQGWAYSLSQVAPKFVQVILICILFFLVSNKNFYQLLLVILMSQISMMIVFIWNTRDELLEAARSRISYRELKSLLHFGLPLVLSGLAYWGLIATSTIALRRWSNFEELGIYSVANSFAGAAAVFQSIFTVIWAPTVFKWASQGDVSIDVIHKVARQALAIICAIVCLGGGVAWMIDFVLPSSYTKVKYILICLMLQPLLYTLSEITSVGIGIQRRTIFSFWITTFALLINICLCFFLVPKFGAAGAAISNAIAFFIFFIGRTEISARIWKKFPRKNNYFFIFILMILAIATALDESVLQGIGYYLWITLLFISLFVFKNEWRLMKNTLINEINFK